MTTNFDLLNEKAKILMIAAYYSGGDAVDTKGIFHHNTVRHLVNMGWLEITDSEYRSVNITPSGETVVILHSAVVPVEYDETSHLDAAAYFNEVFDGEWIEHPTLTLSEYFILVDKLLDTLITKWKNDGYDHDQIAGYEEAVAYRDFEGRIEQYLGELPPAEKLLGIKYPSTDEIVQDTFYQGDDPEYRPSPDVYQDEVQTLLSESISPSDIQDIVDTPQCLCGCGGVVIRGRQFLQGHDARLKSLLLAIGRGERPESDIPAIARGSEFVAKWGVPYGSLPSRKEQRRKTNATAKERKTRANDKAEEVKKRADTKASHKPTGVKYIPLTKTRPTPLPKLTGKNAGNFLGTASNILAKGITIIPKEQKD